MKIDWLKEAQLCGNEIRDIREEIHMHPELGNREFVTAAFIEDRLHEYGIPTVRYLDTAVVGILRGEAPADPKGPASRTVVLRADIDALPVMEETDYAFASVHPGVMHACGHDVHMAAALGAARILSRHRDRFSGEVRFLFQPDEEGRGGAERLVQAGALEGADAVFGAHVNPDLPAGTVGIRYGKFYAAADVFDITVRGRSSHGAEPEKGIDALEAAAALVLALKKLPSELPDRAVLTVGTLQAGAARNILCGEAEMKGIIRTLGQEQRTRMKARLKETVEEISAGTGTVCELDLQASYPGVVNTDGAAAFAEKTALELLGPERVLRITEPTMTSEDFGYYIDALKERSGGCFYHFGTGGGYPLHNGHFLPGPETAELGAAVHAAVLWNFLCAAETP